MDSSIWLLYFSFLLFLLLLFCDIEAFESKEFHKKHQSLTDAVEFQKGNPILALQS